MKLIKYLVLALLLAVSFSALAQHRGGHPGYHGGGHYYNGTRWVAPLIIGAGIGYIATRPYYAPQPVYYPQWYVNAPPPAPVYVQRPEWVCDVNGLYYSQVAPNTPCMDPNGQQYSWRQVQ